MAGSVIVVVVFEKDTPKPQRVIGWQSIMLRTSMPILHVEMCRNRKERRSSAVL